MNLNPLLAVAPVLAPFATTFILGNLTTVSTALTNPYTGETISIQGDYYVNDQYSNGGPGTTDIVLSSSDDQFFSLEDSMGGLLLEDYEIFLLSGGDDIMNLASTTNVHGDVFVDLAEGNDFVWSNAGDDIILGGIGNDVLHGGPGNDVLNAGEDDDILTGASGDDTLDGGSEFDIAIYRLAFSNYSLSVDGLGVITLQALSGDEGTDTIMNVERLQFANGVYENGSFILNGFTFPEFCNGDGGDQMGCTDCPCSNNAAAGTIGGCLNSAGTSARLFGSGDVSVSLPSMNATDLRFSLRGAPANSFVILNSGDAVAPGNAVNPCFGMQSGVRALQFDGLRCAIMNTRRHGGRSADANGDVGLTNNPWGGEGGPPVGIAVAGGGFIAGQTRYFQAINRDDPLLGCMRGINTSQAVEILFAP